MPTEPTDHIDRKTVNENTDSDENMGADVDGEWEATCSCGECDMGGHGEMHDWAEEHVAEHNADDPERNERKRVTVRPTNSQ